MQKRGGLRGGGHGHTEGEEEGEPRRREACEVVVLFASWVDGVGCRGGGGGGLAQAVGMITM